MEVASKPQRRLSEQVHIPKHTPTPGDEPPPYRSSIVDGEQQIQVLPPPSLQNQRFLPAPLLSLSRHHENIMARPFSDEESSEILRQLACAAKVHLPGSRYLVELRSEVESLERTNPTLWRFGDLSAFSREGRDGIKILARRNIRKRWQSLGCWNPDWGIPEMETRSIPQDNSCDWRWAWENEGSRRRYIAQPVDPNHLTSRALRLRKGLRYGEHAPVVPCPSLPPNATAAQAEAFIISRPWFLYVVESVEEQTRIRRLPHEVQRFEDLRFRAGEIVRDRWRKRGDWQDCWSVNNYVGWTWRHESAWNLPQGSQCGLAEDFTIMTKDWDLTPSEMDAYEAIPLLTTSPSRESVVPCCSTASRVARRATMDRRKVARVMKQASLRSTPQATRRSQRIAKMNPRRSTRLKGMRVLPPSKSSGS